MENTYIPTSFRNFKPILFAYISMMCVVICLIKWKHFAFSIRRRRRRERGRSNEERKKHWRHHVLFCSLFNHKIVKWIVSMQMRLLLLCRYCCCCHHFVFLSSSSSSVIFIQIFTQPFLIIVNTLIFVYIKC